MKTTKLVYSDKKVSVVEKDTVNFANVHASHGFFEMNVCGVKYPEVRGWIPFYLTIPERDSIIFVTGRDYDNGQAMIHVVDLRNKAETHFPACDSNIGSNIRDTNNTGTFEEVEKVDGDEVVVVAGSGSARYRYYMNLRTPVFEKEEGYWTNYPNTYVWPGGKRP